MKQRKKTSVIRYFGLVMASVIMLTMTGCIFGPSRVTRETEGITHGIDVARYQGTIDWESVAQTGIDFAIVRIGYRSMSDGQIKPDSNGRYNLQEASKAGIRLGAYFFSTAVSKEEAIEEAKWAAEFVAKYPITYPIVYDCEGYTDPGSRQYALTKEERTDIALAFLETIEDLGYEGMFYASKNEIHEDVRWEVSRIEKDYKIWVAQYPAEPYPATPASSYEGSHKMWQYSMEGTVDGIDQPVDLNIAYFGYDGIEPAKDQEPPITVGPDVEALIDFDKVDEEVTAKDETRLRNMPSQDEDSQTLHMLQNGDVAQRIGVSSSGWSKVIYKNTVCYAVSSYLTTDLNYDPSSASPADTDGDGIVTQFAPVEEIVTAKELVNLRKLPSVEREDAEVLAQLKLGDIATRVGVSDNGWSKLEYNGITCYAVSSYLKIADDEIIEKHAKSLDVGMEFESVSEQVTANSAVNLRTLPSTDRADVKVVVKLQPGDTLIRTGINSSMGWSRVIYGGQTLYCVSRYLDAAD